MKLPLTFAALLIVSASVSDLLAQGQITWGNNLPRTSTTPQVRAPIYGCDPAHPTEPKIGNTPLGLPAGSQTYAGSLLSGTGFTMAIYLGFTAAECLANNTPPPIGGMTTFRTGIASGFVHLFTATDPNIPRDTVGAYYQLRAWNNQNGQITSWSQVMASGGLIPSGTSGVLVLGDPLGGGAGTPPFAAGIRSFQLTQVPEPGMIALGALGLCALLLWRRR